ncbi:MAG: SPOR domain-containing protein [Candidatus Margulisiibacteriota bacterium]
MNENQNRGLEEFEDDEIGIGRNIKRRSSGSSALKGIFFGLILVLLVVGSFWASFMIGKRLLLPGKPVEGIQEENTRTVAVPFPEKKPLPAEKEGLKYPNLERPAKEDRPARVVRKKVIVPEVKKEVPAAVEARPAAESGVYYKVEAGMAPSREQAIEQMKALEEAGFEVFAREIASGSWRVQAGAFKTSDKAEKVAAELTAKGFSAKVIKE